MELQLDPRAAYAGAQGSYALKTVSLKSESLQKLSYTDENGRSFNLTIGNKVEVNYALYTSYGSVQGRGRERGRAEGGDHAQETSAGSPMLGRDPLLGHMLERLRKLLGIQVFDELPGRIQPRPPYSDRLAYSSGVELVDIQQTTTIDMDNVDTDYWSAENTAKRLVDFATSLYAGGDRQEHLKKVLAGIDQGFAEAKEAFGGWLPDISSRTIELAKKNLAEWAAEGGESAPSAEPVHNAA